MDTFIRNVHRRRFMCSVHIVFAGTDSMTFLDSRKPKGTGTRVQRGQTLWPSSGLLTHRGGF